MQVKPNSCVGVLRHVQASSENYRINQCDSGGNGQSEPLDKLELW